MCFEAKYGMGRHVETVGEKETLEQLKVRPPFAVEHDGRSLLYQEFRLAEGTKELMEG